MVSRRRGLSLRLRAVMVEHLVPRLLVPFTKRDKGVLDVVLSVRPPFLGTTSYLISMLTFHRDGKLCDGTVGTYEEEKRP